MIPLTVTAEVETAPVLRHGIALDAVLLWCLGAELGGARADGWEDPDEVVRQAEAGALPLARVQGRSTWWWAASTVPPSGREERTHVHRRAPVLDYERRCPEVRSVNIANGPDKALRIPIFRRYDMTGEIRWTCVGDLAAVTRLLARGPALGRYVAHGHGVVRAWRVEEGGPGVAAYSDPRVRPVPVEDVAALPTGRWERAHQPIRPPYYGPARVPVVRIA